MLPPELPTVMLLLPLRTKLDELEEEDKVDIAGGDEAAEKPLRTGVVECWVGTVYGACLELIISNAAITASSSSSMIEGR